MIKFILVSCLSLFILITNANALPLPTGTIGLQSLPGDFTENYDFAGIVGLSNCSGSLVKFEGAADTSHALVLTNGHCIGEMSFLAPGEFVLHRLASRAFRLLSVGGSELGRLTSTEIVYATMTDTDIAVYKLVETYSEIKAKFGISPLIMSSAHPQIGQSMQVISGFWRRGYECHIEHFVHELREAEWTFVDSIRYTRPGCEVVGGTSGSPIVASGTRVVIGINNTGNESGGRCTMNNPCEVDEKGDITFQKGFSYGQETYLIYSCLNSNNEIDVNVLGCQLPH
ncbi:MAG: hypothetical protein A2Z20_09030 [Bdellovibrionales bacterium RBG_16_40_8]|nr:MAG: hypothetical protein A2Z20_09030 [Bdellovibrionales bacterium RBG_16_40_8]